jgi:predicted RNA-binding Zn-ribbon protein involved in translation (DUF1610 family)
MARWCALKVRIDCPECGTPILVDGPYKRAVCEGCRGAAPVANLWGRLVSRALEDGARGRGFRATSFLFAGNAVPQIFYAANRDHVPLCSACDEPIEAADAVQTGTEGVFHCTACGAAHPTWPAPGYLKSAKIEQVFMAPPEGQSPPANEPASALRPIVFSCVNCGAALRIASETPRVLGCDYCEVDNYLPAEVWNRLHPVRKRRAFWLRCR